MTGLRAMLISIDPGKSGAYAVFCNGGVLQETHKVKVPAKQRFFGPVELDQLSTIIYDAQVERGHLTHSKVTVVMEAFLDQRMNNQSPVATNTTACNHGMQQATCILAGVTKLVIVGPKAWKKEMGLLKQEKSASVELARTLVDPSFLRKPRMRVDNVDIAEAILIGIAYGRKHLQWEI